MLSLLVLSCLTLSSLVDARPVDVRPSHALLAASIEGCGRLGHGKRYLITLASTRGMGGAPSSSITPLIAVETAQLDSLEELIRSRLDNLARLGTAQERDTFIRRLDMFNAISAPLDPATLEELMQRADIAHITADCIMTLDPNEKPSVRRLPSTADVQTGATWGLDRIDQVALPLDNEYDNSGATGAGSTVYVLDTGAPRTTTAVPSRLAIYRLRASSWQHRGEIVGTEDPLTSRTPHIH